MVHAVYPGSFDPLHNGHLDIIKRASRIYDQVTVAVLHNPLKSSWLFNLEERLEILQKSTKDLSNVSADSFNDLLARYIDVKNANVIVKGLRAISDFEYELQMAHLNRQLNRKAETTFIMTATRWSYVSSTRVKELAKYEAYDEVKRLVPAASYQALREKFASGEVATIPNRTVR